MQQFVSFVRREIILCIAAACALISMAFVPISKAYIEYIDLRVLSLLFCLMIVIAGIQECGFFTIATQKLLSGKKRLRMLSLLLVSLPFFSSMFITNDVALITFVPFTLIVLKMAQAEQYAIKLIVLQTIAANLGSMATPSGNPQNLFLFEAFHLSTLQFFSVVFPYVLISFILLAIGAACIPNTKIEVSFSEKATISHPQQLKLYFVLFLLCLLSVFRVIPYEILLVIVIVALLITDKKLFALVDYSLLLLFICFFIVAGNLGQLTALQEILNVLITRSTLLTSLITSQIISNLPAAVLLSQFTTDWQSLLVGVNIGGLGTPIASLASLISLKIYLRCSHAKASRYMFFFLTANVAMLAILTGAFYIFTFKI